MAHSFNFNCMDSSFGDDDDPAYDELNKETFGNIDEDSNWEENHESFANHYGMANMDEDDDYEVNKLGEQVAHYVLDDETEETVPKSNTGGEQTPSHWPGPSVPPHKQILCLEDLERQMRNEAKKNPTVSIKPMADVSVNSDNFQRVLRRGVPLGNTIYKTPAPAPAPLSFELGARPRVPTRSTTGFDIPIPPGLRREGQTRPGGHLHPALLRGGRGRGRRREDLGDIQPIMLQQQEFDASRLMSGPCKPRVPVDEYAGLMTPSEKAWLSQIQLSQLNTSQPYQDDYYYLMYMQKQQGIATRKINNFIMKHSIDLPTNKPTYTPQQFEKSLGKLQAGSVMTPRMVIDSALIENKENKPSEQDKRSKELLLAIERMFTAILDLEVACDQSYNGACKKETLQNDLLKYLCLDKNLIHVMSVRKGRNAVLRALSVLPPCPIIDEFLLEFEHFAKKEYQDDPSFLLSFLPSIRFCLCRKTLPELILLIKSYSPDIFFSTKFTVSVTANFLEAASTSTESADPTTLEEWRTVLRTLAGSTRFWNGTDRPVISLDFRPTLHNHLKLVQGKVNPGLLLRLVEILSKSFNN